MGWYSSAFKRRIAVTIDAVGSGSGAGAIDLSIVVPSKFDAFWANIRSDGVDIVVTDMNGDLATFKRQTFHYPNKLLTLEVDGLNISDKNRMNCVWVYFDSPLHTTDLSSVFTVSGPLTGIPHQGAPGGFVVVPTRGAIANQPLTTFIKDPTEIIDVWFSTSGLFERRATPSNGRNLFDDPSYIEVESLTSGGVNSAARYMEDESRFVDGWVRIRLQAGDDGSDYSVRCIVKSINLNVYVLSCLVKVQKLLPEA